MISEQALPHVAPRIVDKLKKELSETPEGGVINSAITNKAAMLSNAHNKDVLQSCGKKGSDEVLETEEIDMNQVPQLSPESPPSFGDVKDMDGNTSLPGSRCGVS